ncbi:MAG: prepilin peptidase [Parvularcula sp.]|jgi:leader peptidase (prepilin peptidase)/N-methyltransferase|nr:prepilin peptidase [Parvularcula sp.]
MSLLALAAAFGALFGSFANVVISRGPRAWGFVAAEGRPVGLAFPPSRCEACQHRLGPAELIPVVSYLVLKGRCKRCGAAIGLRHLAVEVTGALLAVVALALLGVTAEAAAAFACLLTLLILAVIDLETGYLPDALTLPLLGGGLVHAGLLPDRSLSMSLAGALIGGGSFLLLRFLYQRLRGREGLGGGDVKLLAAGGAWCGPIALPAIILIASVSALLVAFAKAAAKRTNIAGSDELRFGPYLALGIAAGFLFVAPGYPG